MNRKLIVEIVGDASQFTKELKKASAQADETGSKFGKLHAASTKVKVAAGAAGVAIGGALVEGLHSAVDAAANAQVSEARLETAFKSAHLAIDQYREPIDKAVEASANLGFKSADVRDALGSLVVATHSGKKALSELGAAEDIARFKHIDLQQATKLLTSAQAGSQRAAKQLGLEVKTSSNHQATAAKVIALVTEKLHGQAQAYSETAAGAKDKLAANTELLQENIGKGLLPILTQLTGVLVKVTEFFERHTTVLKIVIATVGALAAALIAFSVAAKIAEAAQILFNVALDANPIGAVILGLTLLGAAIYETVQHIDEIKAAFQDAFNWAKDNWPLLLAILTGPIGLAVKFIVDHFATIKAEFAKLTGWAAGPIGTVVSVFEGLPGKISSAVEGGASKIAKAVTGLFDTVSSTFSNIPGEVTAAIGRAIHAVGGFVDDAFKAAERVGVALYHGITSGLAGVAGGLASLVTGAFKAAINAVIKGINKVLDDLYGVLTFDLNTHIPGVGTIHVHPPFKFPTIPELAQGGIVTSPTVAMIGERGPEAVVPLGAASGVGGGTLIIQLNGSEVARAAFDPLRQQAQVFKVQTGKSAFA